MDYFIKHVNKLSQTQCLHLQQLLVAWQDKANIRPYFHWVQIQQRDTIQPLDWLCYQQEELIGYAGVFIPANGPPHLVIVVAPDRCNQGIASLLLAKVSTALAQIGWHHITLIISEQLGNFDRWLQRQQVQAKGQHIELYCMKAQEFTHANLSIRQATLADVSIVAELHASGFNRPIETQQQFYEKYLKQHGVEVWLGSLTDNSAIALVCCEPLAQGGKRLFNFTVHPQYRNQGYAKQMLQNLLHQLQPSTEQPLYIEALSTDSQSLKLYQSCGFLQSARFNHYLIPLGDIVSNVDRTWLDANKIRLLTELQPIRETLYNWINALLEDKARLSAPSLPLEALNPAVVTRWQTLCSLLQLTEFEKNLLLLCIGQELSPDFPSLCAYALGDPEASYPTLDLALRLFEGSINSLMPQNSLRKWQIIEIDFARTLVRSPIKITEHTLHYLLGADALEPAIVNWAKPLEIKPLLIDAYQQIANEIMRQWQATPVSLLQLIGASYEQAEQVTAWLMQETARPALSIDLQALLCAPHQQTQALLLQREIILKHYLVLIDASACHDPLLTSERKQQLDHFLNQLADNFASSVIIYTPRPLNKVLGLTIALAELEIQEQVNVWQIYLNTTFSTDELATICQQFSLSWRQIAAISHQYNACNTPDIQTLWQLCRQHMAQHYDDKVRVVKIKNPLHGLILCDKTQNLLTQIFNQIKYRHKVYNQLGFAKHRQRGLVGISVLFTGPSGTGKTTAAENMASELQLDLLHIDLSSMVSKYVGETEKNLRRIFQQAEKTGAILLFDEADALFGKRSSQVQSSNDRHANTEISFLLQQMEAYRGLSILTTNLQSNIDEAFIRRFRFVVPFSMPTQEQRIKIWQQAFPLELDTSHLDWVKLAKLDLSGANIQVAALNAVFLAVAQNTSLDISHILLSIKQEFNKLGKLDFDID